MAGQIEYDIEVERVHRVVEKLARGHAAYELGEPQLEEPSGVNFATFGTLEPPQLELFENPPIPDIWPEVGSRGFQRLAELGASRWLIVQPNRYRYLAVARSESVVVRVVLSEYLACEVIWEG